MAGLGDGSTSGTLPCKEFSEFKVSAYFVGVASVCHLEMCIF